MRKLRKMSGGCQQPEIQALVQFIVCERFNTPRLAAESWVLNLESNTLPKQHTSSLQGEVVD
jgi:hypothetical protein